MFIVTVREGGLILNGEKVATLRPVRESGKGYHRKGGIYWVCQGRDFVNGKICKVLVTGFSFVDIEEMAESEFPALGYSSKAEYMGQPYNQRQTSSHRVRYDFITLENLAELVESLEICPANFFYVWEMVKDCRELTAGVNPALIFEGCDCQDLEDQYLTIQGNIRGAL